MSISEGTEPRPLAFRTQLVKFSTHNIVSNYVNPVTQDTVHGYFITNILNRVIIIFINPVLSHCSTSVPPENIR